MKLVQRFFRDSGIYGLAMILTKGLTILLVPVYTALLTKAEMGMLDLLLGWTAIGTLLVGFDISNALAREYGEAHDERLRKRFSSTALWFSVGMFGFAAVVGQVLAPFIARWTFGAEAALALAPVKVAFLSMAVSGVYLVVVQQLRWMLRPVCFGVVSITYTVVSLSGTIGFSGALGLGVSGVFWGMALGALVGGVLAHFYSKGEFGVMFDRRLLRKMLRFCLPLIPSSLAVVVSQYVARFFVEHHLGLGQVGVFGVSVRLAGLMGLVMLGFGSALTPLIYANQHDPETPAQLAQIFKIFVALASVGLGGFSLFIPEILAVLARGDYTESRWLLPWLAPAILLAQMYIFAPGPWIARRTSLVAGINVGSALLAVLLNALLVPVMGIVGAAVATLLSALANFAASMSVSQSLFAVPHRWGRLWMALLPGIAVMLAASLVPGEISAVTVGAKALGLLGLAVVVAWVSGFGVLELRGALRAFRGRLNR